MREVLCLDMKTWDESKKEEARSYIAQRLIANYAKGDIEESVHGEDGEDDVIILDVKEDEHILKSEDIISKEKEILDLVNVIVKSSSKSTKYHRHKYFINRTGTHRLSIGFGFEYCKAQTFQWLCEWLKERVYVKDRTNIFHPTKEIKGACKQLKAAIDNNEVAVRAYIADVLAKEVVIMMAMKYTGETYSTVEMKCAQTEKKLR